MGTVVVTSSFMLFFSTTEENTPSPATEQIALQVIFDPLVVFMFPQEVVLSCLGTPPLFIVSNNSNNGTYVPILTTTTTLVTPNTSPMKLCLAGMTVVRVMPVVASPFQQ